MDKELIKTRVYQAIADILGIQDCQISPDSNLIEDLGADQLDVIELVMSLEEEFNIFITETECDEIATVNDAVECVERHV